LLQEGGGVLSIEFKINMLRPATGNLLRCRGEVLKAGRTITVAESWVYASSGAEEKMVAKATVTLAVVPLEK
jgi:acyl-coenzyme A thioesterase PaaI-like protein